MELTINDGTAAAPAVVKEQAVSTVNVDQAIEDWKAYQKVTAMILDESDYVDIKGNQYKKKSAWRKYSRAFNISTEILEKEILKNDKGSVTEATFVVRATLPSGRYCDGWGNCSRREGNKAHPNHDIPATAHTRASNRAIADLIGAGEVSAEEIMGEVKAAAREKASQQFQRSKTKAKPQPIKPKAQDLEFIDVPAQTVIDSKAKSEPKKIDQPNKLNNVEEIASSIIAELPQKTRNAAWMELVRLNRLGVLDDEECSLVKIELNGRLDD